MALTDADARHNSWEWHSVPTALLAIREPSSSRLRRAGHGLPYVPASPARM